MKLLLVEDDELLSKVIIKGLKKCGYAVDAAFDGEEALVSFEINEYDLIILDLNIPVVDGMNVLKRIRQTNNEIKILILSARSEIEDRVAGLDFGANDYLIKPFDFAELEARIRNLLRRAFIQRPTLINCGMLRVDIAAKMVFADSKQVELTRKEYGILEYLVLNRNKIVSSEEIIEHVWDSETGLFSNSLKYHIHSLKKKLAVDCETVGNIRNVRGQGYIIEGE